MGQFRLTRESATKLWVETPIPVPNSVWGYFVLDMFPPLNLTYSLHISRGGERHDSDIVKVLDREPGRFRVADGQQTFFWIHAYLPDDSRTSPLDDSKSGVYGIATKGLIFVPEQQPYYLDQIVGDLEQNGDYRAEQLQVMMKTAREMLIPFFSRLEGSAKEVPEGQPYHTFYDQFRDGLEKEGITKEVTIHWGSPLPSPINNLRNYLANELAWVVGEAIETRKSEKTDKYELGKLVCSIEHRYQSLLK